MDISSIPKIRDLILNQAYLNVKVKILVREAYKNDEPTRLNSIRKLLKDAEKSKSRQNISIREYHYAEDPFVKSSVHAKFVIADSTHMYLGSGELRKNSIEKNFETGILVQGTISKDLEKVFLDIFEASEDIV
jgi:phosphatidylserine/phosphatidylglycerophosphate/cardiolipin synthase-like enzyme